MADIVVEIIIPDDENNYIQLIRDMLISNGNQEITLSLWGGRNGSKTFTFDARREGEGEVPYFKRFIKENLLAYLRLKAQNDKIAIYKQLVSEIPDVPVVPVDEETII